MRRMVQLLNKKKHLKGCKRVEFQDNIIFGRDYSEFAKDNFKRMFHG